MDEIKPKEIIEAFNNSFKDIPVWSKVHFAQEFTYLQSLRNYELIEDW